MRHFSVSTQKAEMQRRTKKGNVQSAPEDEEDNLVKTMDAKFNHTNRNQNNSSNSLAVGKRLSFIL